MTKQTIDSSLPYGYMFIPGRHTNWNRLFLFYVSELISHRHTGPSSCPDPYSVRLEADFHCNCEVFRVVRYPVKH